MGPVLASNPLLPRPEPRALRPAVLAIGGGNSKTDVALVASDGTLLASARGPGINAHEVGVDQTMLILDAVVKQAAAQLGGGHRRGRSGWVAQHTVACLANADLPEEEAEHAAAVQAQAWSPTATVVNDTFAILRSGLADKDQRHWGVAGSAVRASTPSASRRTAASPGTWPWARSRATGAAATVSASRCSGMRSARRTAGAGTPC